MRFHYIFGILIALFAQMSVFGQEVVLDSLAEKNYSELKDIFYNTLDKNDSLAKKIAYYTINKATKDKRYEAFANGYIRLHYIFEDNYDLAEKYVDSSITICKTYNLEELLAENYNNKGDLHYDSGRYNSALNYYLQSRSYYKNRRKSSYFNLHYSVGLVKLRIQANEDALNIFKECLAYREENITNEDTIVPYSYLNNLRSLAIAYGANRKLDSVSILNKKGYELASLHPEYNELKFTHIEGGNQFLKGNYKASEDSLIKSLPFLKRLKSKGDFAIASGHLGRIYVKYGKLEKAMFYFKKVDSIYNTTNYLIPDPRDPYLELIKYYKSKEDLKQQLYYTEQLLKIDSILTKDYRDINTTFKEYDVSNLITEKEKLRSLLNKEKNTFNRNIIFLSTFIFLLVSLFTYMYRKKIKNEKQFSQIIDELKRGEPQTYIVKNTAKTKLDIDQNIIDQILEALKLFEDNKEYLEQRLTLNKLAKKLNTNSKYLSKVINKFKSKTFNNYINDLRVAYVMQQLQSKTQFRNYTIKAIAEEVGFTNTETFTKAFFKKTGLTVSYFMKKLDK